MKDSSRLDLNNVTMKIYSKDGASYDLVHSAAAQFFTSDQHLYSDGEVEMTLGVPVEGQARRTLVSIKSSGVTFDSATNRVETDRAASFVFDNGEGTGTGAFYDPTTHELRIKSDVKLDWKPAGTPSAPSPKPLKIEAASLAYHEAISEIWLKPWGRLARENTVVEGEHVVVHLQDSVTSDGQRRTAIRQVEASKAHGSDTYPNRKLEYSAGEPLGGFRRRLRGPEDHRPDQCPPGGGLGGFRDHRGRLPRGDGLRYREPPKPPLARGGRRGRRGDLEAAPRARPAAR